jgi:hypothetical protein
MFTYGVLLTQLQELRCHFVRSHTQTKTMLKPIWTYGIQMCRAASTSNIGILERFQSNALRIIVDAPWYVPNIFIGRDLRPLTVKEEMSHYSSQYQKADPACRQRGRPTRTGP